VRTERKRISAISTFVWPRASSCATSSSRGVRLSISLASRVDGSIAGPRALGSWALTVVVWSVAAEPRSGSSPSPAVPAFLELAREIARKNPAPANGRFAARGLVSAGTR